jgi:hypothetical protein
MRHFVRHRLRLGSFVLVVALTLAACGAAETAPTPTPFQPSVTIFAPTPAPTETPQPTAAPTATIAGEAVAEAVAEAAISDTAPVAVILDGSINPYTGLAVADPAVLARKPLLIKVANTAEVRPQSGLGSADVVVEHLSEGSITRFTALFLTSGPDKIGSVRSCRLIDIELPVIFDAALVCSGTSPGVKPLMRDSYAHRNELTMISDFGPYECATCPMFRTRDRRAPHNLFANASNAWKELDQRGKNAPSTFNAWTFSDAQPQGKSTAQVDVAYRSGTVGWSYDAGTGKWLRSLRGQQQVDAATREPISASNVLVVFAHHQNTLIQEDVGGSRSIEIQLWGEGPLRAFRDGVEIGGRWKRGADVGSLEFVDVNGNEIPFKPGKTWIELVPIKGDVPVVTR